MSLKLVTFDLDNTLWDVHSVIVNAEQRMRAWLMANVPEVVALYEGPGIDGVRAEVVEAHPEARHDLSKLRTLVVARSIERTGRGEAEARELADQAFVEFYEGRHEVEYYEHALDVLGVLSERYTLAALSNGNASIVKLGLDRYFHFSCSSAEVGASKPAPDMFHAALRQADSKPHQAVHIGDHPDHDVRAAHAVGMHTIWVPFSGGEAPPESSGQVESLDQLPAEIDRISAELAR